LTPLYRVGNNNVRFNMQNVSSVGQQPVPQLQLDILLGMSSDQNTTPPPAAKQPVAPESPDEFVKEAEKPENTIQFGSLNIDRRTGIIAAAGAVIAAGATFLIMRGRNADNLQKAQGELRKACQEARDEAWEAYSQSSRRATKSLKEGIEMQDKAMKMQSEASALKRRLQDEINAGVEAAKKGYAAEAARFSAAMGDTSDAPLAAKLDRALRAQMDTYELGYDPTKPFVSASSGSKTGSKEGFMEFFPLEKTKPREGMKPLDMPEFQWGQDWSFELPTTNHVCPSRVTEQITFNPTTAQTNISMNYANSLQWDDRKIARDLLQNFYDGHGQTLDGVRFSVIPLADGKSKIRIEGRGLYTPDKAILLGETTKAGDTKAAGNYGEGLKMTVLKLLNEKGAKNVEIGSDGWRVVYEAATSDLNKKKKVLQYTLENATNSLDGNYIEFETSSPELVKSIRGAIDHFYNSGNKDFADVDFETALFGIKKVQGAGRAYINGQRFEYGKPGNWEGLDGVTVFFNEKPPTSAFDASRDRVALSDDNLKNIIGFFAGKSETSEYDILNTLRLLEDQWTKIGKDKTAPKALLEGLLNGAYIRGMKVDFPDKYLAAYYGMSQDILQDLTSSGYKVCNEGFANIGMKSARDFITDARNHGAFEPTEIQKKKIGLIQSGIQKLAKYLEGDDFSPGELNPKIYLFDATGEKEAATYRHALAEAIIDRTNYSNPISRGYWLDRNYLNTGSFVDHIGTGLHEITHKAGGDSSQEFSYKLTDVLDKVIEAAMADGKSTVGIELHNMQRLWNELSELSPAA